MATKRTWGGAAVIAVLVFATAYYLKVAHGGKAVAAARILKTMYAADKRR